LVFLIGYFVIVLFSWSCLRQELQYGAWFYIILALVFVLVGFIGILLNNFKRDL